MGDLGALALMLKSYQHRSAWTADPELSFSLLHGVGVGEKVGQGTLFQCRWRSKWFPLHRPGCMACGFGLWSLKATEYILKQDRTLWSWFYGYRPGLVLNQERRTGLWEGREMLTQGFWETGPWQRLWEWD